MRSIVASPRLRLAAGYVCPKGFHVRRKQTAVDDLIETIVVKRLNQPDAVEALTAADEEGVRQAIAAAELIRAQLDEASDMYPDRIDGDQLARITARLRPELERREAELRAMMARPDLLDLIGITREQWDDVPLDRKRAVIKTLGMRIRIMPTGSGGRFDPRSVKVTWHP